MQRVFKIFIKIVIIHFYGLWAINHPFIADRIKIDCALYCRLFKHCTLRNGLHDFISHDSYSYIPFYSLFARLQKYFFFEIIPGFISKCLKMAKNCPILIFDPSFWFTKKLTLQIILHRFIPKRFSLLLRITIFGPITNVITYLAITFRGIHFRKIWIFPRFWFQIFATKLTRVIPGFRKTKLYINLPKNVGGDRKWETLCSNRNTVN